MHACRPAHRAGSGVPGLGLAWGGRGPPWGGLGVPCPNFLARRVAFWGVVLSSGQCLVHSGEFWLLTTTWDGHAQAGVGMGRLGAVSGRHGGALPQPPRPHERSTSPFWSVLVCSGQFWSVLVILATWCNAWWPCLGPSWHGAAGGGLGAAWGCLAPTFRPMKPCPQNFAGKQTPLRKVPSQTP